jgi:hypothetical protein
MNYLRSLHLWLARKVIEARQTQTAILGIPILVDNSRPDIETRDVLARLERALGLIRDHARHHFRHLRRDFSRIIVARYACRGAYLPETRSCLVELTFSVNPDFSDAEVAATILHEAMHARLHRLGLSLEMADRARQERFCRRAEIEFGEAVPGGGPVIARALSGLAASDEHVAPTIDPLVAAQRVAQADLEALAAPRWLKRLLARRQGVQS